MSDHPKLGWFVSHFDWWKKRWYEPTRGVTDSYEQSIASFPRVMLLSSDGVSVDGVASASKNGHSDSFRRKIRFRDWDYFEPFEIQSAVGKLRGSAKMGANNTIGKQIGEFTSLASSEILSWLDSKELETAEIIRSKFSNEEGPDWLNDTSEEMYKTYWEQFDGFKLGLEIAGFDRSMGIESLLHPSSPNDIQLRNIYDDTSVNLREDQIITNDLRKFLDWQNIPSVVSGAVFYEPYSGRRLRTFLANRLPLESQTGADIIYYVNDTRSFVLVQYKRCKDEKGTLIYRPDTQFYEQLKTMKELQNQVVDSDLIGLQDHRLGTSFCYFKLCRPNQPLEPKLSEGKYFDIGGMELAIGRGSRGGRIVHYDNAMRYLTNSLFADLVSQGWVGSAGNVSEEILGIMEDSLDNDRSVLLADIELGGRRGRSGPNTRRFYSAGFVP